jgi:hypothetical protein
MKSMKSELDSLMPGYLPSISAHTENISNDN